MRILLALFLFLAASHAPVLAQGTVKTTFGDWEMRCEGQGNDEQCILYQNLADDSRPDINLVIVVLKVTDQGQQGQPIRRPVLRVIAPLGVLLPRGLGLRIESATEKDAQGKAASKDIGSTGFVKCVPSGCVAEVDMDERLTTEFSGGATATFIIFQTPSEGRGLPLTLKGFKEGIAALK
jgi:invasion protein IalB